MIPLMGKRAAQKTTNTQPVPSGPPELIQPGEEGQPDQHAQQGGETEVGQPGHVRLGPEQQESTHRIVDQVAGIECQEQGQDLGGPFQAKGHQQTLVLVTHPDLVLDESVGKVEVGQSGDHEQEILDRMEVIAIEPIPEIILQGHGLHP